MLGEGSNIIGEKFRYTGNSSKALGKMFLQMCCEIDHSFVVNFINRHKCDRKLMMFVPDNIQHPLVIQ